VSVSAPVSVSTLIDIEKENILITTTGDAMLCDFGFSRIRHGVARSHTIIRQGGRFRFIAPEISAADPDFRTNEPADIYSLAMTIYALGVGSVPFEELKNCRAADDAARRGVRPSSRDSLGGLTTADTKLLWFLLTKMWDHDPQRRPTASVIRDEILWLLPNRHLPLPGGSPATTGGSGAAGGGVTPTQEMPEAGGHSTRSLNGGAGTSVTNANMAGNGNVNGQHTSSQSTGPPAVSGGGSGGGGGAIPPAGSVNRCVNFYSCHAFFFTSRRV